MDVVDLLQSIALLLLGICILRLNRRRPRQTQTSGHNSTQIQSGGTIHLPKAALISNDLPGHRSTEEAEAAAARFLKNGRHL